MGNLTATIQNLSVSKKSPKNKTKGTHESGFPYFFLVCFLWCRTMSMNKGLLMIFPQQERVACKEIAAIVEKQQKESKIGIRLLNSAIHQYFMKDIL